MLLPNLRLSYSNNNNKNNNQPKKKRQHELKYFITKMPKCVVKIFLRNSIHGNKLLSKNPNLSKQKELYKKIYMRKKIVFYFVRFASTQTYSRIFRMFFIIFFLFFLSIFHSYF